MLISTKLSDVHLSDLITTGESVTERSVRITPTSFCSTSTSPSRTLYPQNKDLPDMYKSHL